MAQGAFFSTCSLLTPDAHPEDIPIAFKLEFPPFPPKKRQERMATPFHLWETEGIVLPSARHHSEKQLEDPTERFVSEGRDSYGGKMIAVAESGDATGSTYPKVMPKSGRSRLNIEDSWKIGSEPDWKEPITTSTGDYHTTRPPFSRLIMAVREFMDSRTAAFAEKNNKYLFLLAMFTLGLRTELPGAHWPGTGPDGEAYVNTHASRRNQRQSSYSEQTCSEVCSLLRDPEKTVRGFLSQLRKETEASWDVTPALLLAKMFAAFMAYIEFHEVISDPFLQPAFQRATIIAREASSRIKQSKAIEDTLDDPSGLNAVSFMFCGTRDKRSWAKPETPKVAAEDAEKEDDGGWSLSPDTPTGPTPDLSASEAVLSLQTQIAPVAFGSIRLLNYVPDARRWITAVFPPTEPGWNPQFMSTHWRLRTERGSPTDNDDWKLPVTQTTIVPEYFKAGTTAIIEAIKESSTCTEPDELDVWFDGAGLDLDRDSSWIVGMGLRGEWAQIGMSDKQSWWIFKLGDDVMPSFSRSTEADDLARKDDPPVPYAATVSPANTPSGAQS